MWIRIFLFFFCTITGEASFSAGKIRFQIFEAPIWEHNLNTTEEYVNAEAFSAKDAAKNEAAYLRLKQNMLAGGTIIFPLNEKN